MKTAVLLMMTIALAMPATAAAPPGPPPVFISPSGEPFRPGPSSPSPFDAWFDQADANHDGRIDRAEFRADAERFFKKLDVNGDGVIDGFEVAAYEKTVAPELDIAGQGFASGGSARVGTVSLLSDPEPVSGADMALNSHISLAEWLQVADQRFALLDARRQGYLTREGLRALLPKEARERK